MIEFVTKIQKSKNSLNIYDFDVLFCIFKMPTLLALYMRVLFFGISMKILTFYI